MSDDSSNTSLKLRIISSVAEAAGGKPPCELNAACQPCHRLDWQVLVVTPSVVPKEHEAALKEAGYAWASSFDAAFGSIPREATLAVARLARKGYVFVYYPQRDLWDVWQVMDNGLTRKIIHQASVKQYSKAQSAFLTAGEPKLCSRGAANLPAHLISIPQAKVVDKVWLAYSSRLWSPFVLKRFAANPEVAVTGPDGKPAGKKKLRDLRGRELQPQSLISGGSFPAGCLPLNALALQHNVADFIKEASPGFKKAFELSLKPLDGLRFGQAEAFDKTVRAIEKASHPTQYLDKSLVVMLPDDVGVVEQHNHLRLCAQEAQRAWVAGAPDFNKKNDDPLRSWKLRSSLHAEMIEHWVFAEKGAREKELFDAGGYRDHQTISEHEYQQMREQERRTGKPYYPAGTSIVANKSAIPTYRVTMPEWHTKQGLDGVAAARSQDRIERYHGKLRMGELQKFRDDFKAGVEGWQAHIDKFDRDYIAWLTGPRLFSTLRYDFNEGLRLIETSPENGTVQQQVEEYFDRIGALEKAWGGGGIGPASIKELAKAYGQDANAPATWIDKALLEPWGLYTAIKDDPGKRKDTAEKINGLVRELPEQVKEALHARHERHEEHVHSLTHAHQQAAQLQATLLDPAYAKKIGTAATTQEEVMRAFTVHVRTAAVVNIMLNPRAERYVTIAVKLPTGETLDEMASAIGPRKLETTLESKSTTNRQERRKSRSELRKLDKYKTKGLQTPEFQPLILTEAKLAELTRQAVRQGEALVDVVAEGTLGELSQSFKLPKSTALKLVSEQAGFATAAWQAMASRQVGVVGVVGFFQFVSLQAALHKLGDEEGYAYADTLMTVMGSTAGLLEGSLGLSAAVFEIKASGSKLVLGSRVTWGASLRLVAGIAGAASSGFDAVAAFAKAASRRERGEKAAADMYANSGLFFLGSMGSLFGGTTIAFANATVARFAISRLVVTRLGGAAAAELLCSSLTGIGIVLGALGFAGMLYAESLEDDLNEIFLKRSYWGNGERSEAKFAASEEPPTKTDAEALLRRAQRGLSAEVDGFTALSVGFKASLVWHSNITTANVIQARIETAVSNEKRRVSYELVITPATTPGLSSQNAEMELDKESGHYVLDLKLPLDERTWRIAQSAKFTFNVYEEFERCSIARDTLEVKRG